MTENTNNIEEQEEPSLFDNIDYLRILTNCLRFWWLFAISLAIAVGIAWYINKTSAPVYRAGTMLLLKESRGGSQMYELTQGFGLSGEQSNLENQRYIYSSPKMIERAIKGIHFEVTYMNVGRLLDIEMFGMETPFRVCFDTLHCQPIGASFVAEYLTPQKIKLHVTGSSISGYSYLTNNYTGYYKQNVDTTIIAELDKPNVCDMFSFTLVSNRTYSAMSNAPIRFYFNTIQSIVNQWQGRVDFQVTSQGGTVALITAVGSNTNKLIAFLRGLNAASMKYNLDKKNETATRTLTFLKEQLNQTADSLAAATERLKQFKIHHGFASRTEYASDLDRRYFTYDEQVRDMNLRRENLCTLREKLTEGSAIEDYFTVATFNDNPLIAQQVANLIDIQKTLYGIRNQNEDNPYKKLTRESETLAKSNLHTLIDQSIATYDLKISELRNQMHSLVAESGHIPDMETQNLSLERDYKIQDAVYTFLLQKESETLIAKASNTADNEVLQEPVPMGQIGPDANKNYTTGIAIGFLLPAAFFFLLELLNRKIRTLKELKKSVPNVPVIGVVPLDKNCGDTPTITQPQSAISECFRTLRTKLLFLSADHKVKIITFSSCNPSEGKTFCAINTAICFAQAGQKCLLMNYDLRRPRAEKALGITNKIGLTDYLVGNAQLEEIITHCHIQGLDVIPSGTIPPNPSELIVSTKNHELIEKLKSMYDIIIMDTAPVGCVADARLLIKSTDAYIFVTKANITEYAHLKETIESLIEEKTTNLNLLFNGASHSKREYYRYGSYYGYSNYGDNYKNT